MTTPTEPPIEPRPRRSPVAAVAGTFGANVGAAVLGLANVLIISRALGPTGRGSVVFLMTMAMLVSTLATLGIQKANGTFGAARPAARSALATNSVLFSVLLGGLSALAVLALIAGVPSVGADSDPKLRWLVLGFAPVAILSNYLWNLAQSDYRFAVTNLVWLLPPVVNVAVNGVLAAMGALTVTSAILVWLAGQTAGTLVMVWYVARRLSGFGRPDPRLGRETLAFGAKTHLGTVGMLGNFRLDQWLLGSIAGAHALGLYSVAVAWAEVLFFLPTALVIVQRPDLVRASPREAGRQAAVAFRACAVVTVGLAGAMALAAPFLCVTVFGDEFRGSIPDLRLLLIGGLGVVALKLLGNALTCQGKPLLETAGVMVAFAVTVALDIALIPLFDDRGAAVASAAAYSAGGLAMAVIFVRRLRTPPKELLPRGDEGALLYRKLRGTVRRPAGASR
ncbi:MAG: oligosaccharide flippase family protein [Gaiellaceae bacterium]